jgi:hypothetical protein
VGVPGVKKVYGANLSVQVMLNDTVLGTGVTNNKGVAKITFTAALAKGTYKLVAVVTGNVTYGSSMSAANKTKLKVT